MAPTPAPVTRWYTYTNTDKYTYTVSYSIDYPYDSNIARTVVSAWIVVGVIFGIQALGLIIVAIVFFQRQKKRKAWYGRMAAHYRNGGLLPWTMVGVYNTNSDVTYPPANNSNPKAQYEDSTRFGVYGNLPPSYTSNMQSTGLYSNTTGVTGYTAASYHTASNVPLTPPPQPLSPQRQHSQYTSTTGSFEPYSAPPNPYNANPYALPAAPPEPLSGSLSPTPRAPVPAVHPELLSGPSSPPPRAPAPYGTGPAYGSPPKGPAYTEASSSAQTPAYSSGAYGANEYPTEKGWE